MRNFLKNLKLNETNVSMLLGVVVVLIVGGLLVNYFKSINKVPETSSANTESSITETPKLENLPADYEVQKGDTLWMLSEKVYGTGYNWGDIYESNKETLGTNPNVLTEGTKLTFPKVEPKQLSATSSDTEEIAPATHVVEKGDNLWKIAEMHCEDGYSWTNISTANNLANPNVIEVGQELQVVCR